jgi:hypothetical protein
VEVRQRRDRDRHRGLLQRQLSHGSLPILLDVARKSQLSPRAARKGLFSRRLNLLGSGTSGTKSTPGSKSLMRRFRIVVGTIPMSDGVPKRASCAGTSPTRSSDGTLGAPTCSTFGATGAKGELS